MDQKLSTPFVWTYSTGYGRRSRGRATDPSAPGIILDCAIPPDYPRRRDHIIQSQEERSTDHGNHDDTEP